MTRPVPSDVPEDRREHREWLLSRANLPSTGLVVDLGCGKGEDLCLLAARDRQAATRFIGVDVSEKGLATAAERSAEDRRISFSQARLAEHLPFSDASVDLVYSHNLLECLADPRAFASEVTRILRPGGQVVVGHWDWDTQLFDGTDKDLVRRLVHAYADWQQAWMDHADAWMGRRLWGVFNETGQFNGRVEARTLINTVYAAPWLGHANAQAFQSLVKRGLVCAEDWERFAREQFEHNEQGRYFYSITGVAYVGWRTDHNTVG